MRISFVPTEVDYASDPRYAQYADMDPEYVHNVLGLCYHVPLVGDLNPSAVIERVLEIEPLARDDDAWTLRIRHGSTVTIDDATPLVATVRFGATEF